MLKIFIVRNHLCDVQSFIKYANTYIIEYNFIPFRISMVLQIRYARVKMVNKKISLQKICNGGIIA